MTGSNLMHVHDYLRAVASMDPFEKVAEFYSPDVVIEEFPNRIAPQGRVRRANELSAAYEQGRRILQTQSYNVQRAIEAGDEVAVELE